jgi:hypothetical protein
MIERDVAILMPVVKPENYELFTLRYEGLADELVQQDVTSFFTEGHASYQADGHAFVDIFDVRREAVAGFATASVVRDLTMPKDDDRPLYLDSEAPTLVHQWTTNRLLADKSNLVRAISEVHPLTRVAQAADIIGTLDEVPGDRVVVKPITGERSKDVQVLTKKQAATATYKPGEYLVQEFINTDIGVAELDVQGTHNIRMISIGNTVVGAVARVGGTSRDILKDDVYGKFIDVDTIPDSMHEIAIAVHGVLRTWPGRGENVIAIDVMRGINAAGNQVDVLCEVNRRPQRISRRDALDGRNHDIIGLLRLGKLWDQHEAALLARQIA